MDNYSELTNPIPYMVATFGIAFLLLVGYGAVLALQRKRLIELEQSLSLLGEQTKNPAPPN